MGDLWVCLNVYQEETLLPDCLRSIRQNLPNGKIILIDGAYQSWVRHVRIQAAMEYAEGNETIAESMMRFTSAASTDRTVEIAREFGVEHIIMPSTQCMCGGKKYDFGYYEKGEYLPWESEWQKRARFFEFGREGDYYFIVDADERVIGTPEPMTEEHYAVMLKRDDDVAPYRTHRVFRHQYGIKMAGAHMAVWVPRVVQDPQSKTSRIQEVLLRRDEAPVLKNCSLLHLFNERGTRDQVRHMAKGAYYRNGLLKEEEAFRTQHGV